MWVGSEAGIAIGEKGSSGKAAAIGTGFGVDLYAARIFFIGTELRAREVLASRAYPEAFTAVTFGFRVPSR
jgi:hypothetical protein